MQLGSSFSILANGVYKDKKNSWYDLKILIVAENKTMKDI